MVNYDDEKDSELEGDAKRATDETKDTLAEAGDKIKAGAKAVGNKIKDPDRDLDTEYDKEKLKEDLN